MHKTATDDKKLQSTLKKLAVNSIPGIEEVNMFKDDGNVLHFTNPKVQASLQANTFAISGNCEDKRKRWCALVRIIVDLQPVIVEHNGLETQYIMQYITFYDYVKILIFSTRSVMMIKCRSLVCLVDIH